MYVVMKRSTKNLAVIIPNLNGGDMLLDAIESLLKQAGSCSVIVVDNASSDGSADDAVRKFPSTHLIRHKRNRGYAGGVNTGLRHAIKTGARYVAVFNDDAVADSNWLKYLVSYLDEHSSVGAVACKVLSANKETFDSAGDYLTTWGLPYPRGRGETDRGQYDTPGEIFAASGAASLFRTEALKDVGLFDEAFFAYYEDVDLGFRMQNRGWKVGYEPKAVAYHAIGATSSRMRGFTTYQTLKNLPLLVWKNMPFWLLFPVLPRFYLAYWMFFWRAVLRGHGWSAVRGVVMATFWLVWKLPEIMILDAKRKVSTRYIWSILQHDLPPNAHSLRKFQDYWRKIWRKRP